MFGGDMNESNNRSVLHIDDDPAMLKLVHQKLTACGYDVTSLLTVRKRETELPFAVNLGLATQLVKQ